MENNSTIEHVRPTPGRFVDAVDVGLQVFPVRAQSKAPAVKWSNYQGRDATDAELESWEQSDLNVGVICGRPSAIVVVDADSAEAIDFLERLGLPCTPTVKTARGRHYYFRPPAIEVRNSVRLGGHKIDIRGDGGYVVGAGSVHESGALYEWIISPEEAPFAAFPEALLALMTKPKPASASPPVQGRSGCTPENCTPLRRWLNQGLRKALDELGAATEGERNDTLFKVAVRFAADVAGAGEGWAPFADALRESALEIGLGQAETEATLASAWKRGSAEPTPWLSVPREWVWLGKPDVFYHRKSGEHLKPQAFNKRFARFRVGKKTLAQYLLEHELIPMVQDLTYEPRDHNEYLERDGLSWLNTYQRSEVDATDGDPTPFLDFVEYLVPEQAEREHLLQMMAWSIRNPGQKIRHALLLRSREQGIGKSMLTEIWGELLGRRNIRKTSTEEVSGDFQGFIKEKLLIVLEELNWGVGPTGYNRLKTFVTEDIVAVNEKFMPVRHWPNYATFVILTNLQVPILIEDSDRRIFYVDSPAKRRQPDYYREFVLWWRANLGVIRGFIDSVDLSSFNPNAPPPMTRAKEQLIAESRGELVKDLALAIEERWGVFDRDIVTLEEVERQLGPVMRGKTRAQLTKALKDIGAVPLGQQRVHGMWKHEIFIPQEGRASLWAVRHPWFWERTGAQERSEEWARSEGFFAIYDHLAISVCPASGSPGDRW